MCPHVYTHLRIAVSDSKQCAPPVRVGSHIFHQMISQTHWYLHNVRLQRFPTTSASLLNQRCQPRSYLHLSPSGVNTVEQRFQSSCRLLGLRADRTELQKSKS